MILRCLLIVASPYAPYTSSVPYMDISMCTPTPFQCARLLDFNVYAYSNTGVGVHINIYILICIVHIWYTGGTGGFSTGGTGGISIDFNVHAYSNTGVGVHIVHIYTNIYSSYMVHRRYRGHFSVHTYSNTPTTIPYTSSYTSSLLYMGWLRLVGSLKL